MCKAFLKATSHYVVLIIFLFTGIICIDSMTSVHADELASVKTFTTTVKYHLQNPNYILVVAYPNREYGSQFLFDTGTNQMVIVRSIATRLHLETRHQLDAHGDVIKSALDGKPEQYAVLPQMQIGEIVLTNIPCIVADDNSLYSGIGVRVNGIIGASLLKLVSVCIDFKAQEITLINHLTLTDTDLKSLQFGNAASMPFALNQQGFPSVLLSLQHNGATSEEYVVVDTAAVTTNISSATAKAINLKGVFQIHQSDVMSGERVLNYDTVDKVSCADFTRKNVAVYFPDQDQVHGANPHLGLDFLTNYSILFDAGSGKLYFKSLRTE